MESVLRDFIKKLLIVLCVLIVASVALSFYIIRYSSITDNVAPQWKNQNQSDAWILQGERISLQADGRDNFLLRKAVLATNESGVWRNETEYAFMWRQEAVFGFDNFGTASYEDGVLYAPSKGDNKVYAINASDGNVIWSITVRQCDASPYIDEDVIYVGECMGPDHEPIPSPKAMALNKTNGEVVWEFVEPNGSTWVGSPVVYGDYVYFTTYGSGVYALNKTNGAPIWQRDVGKIVCSVAYHNGMVFVSAHEPSGQYAFNATTGDIIWQKNYGASWDSSPVIYQGMIVQVTRNTANVWSAYVLNETNGEVIRKFDGKGSCSTPLVYDGKIFIPSEDRRIWAFDLTSGSELWHTVQLHNGTLQNHSYCSPVLAGGAIYYQALNGTFYVIDEADGSVLWSYNLGGYGFGSPSVGDGCVFITNDFALYAFRIGPGVGDWRMFCGDELHQSVSENGIKYVRYPLTEPKDFVSLFNVWVTVKFVWCNKTIASDAIAWRIYFFDVAGNVNATDVMVFRVRMPVQEIAAVNSLFRARA